MFNKRNKESWKPKWWRCTEGGHCEYDLWTDPVADYCVKCGCPHERK